MNGSNILPGQRRSRNAVETNPIEREWMDLVDRPNNFAVGQLNFDNASFSVLAGKYRCDSATQPLKRQRS